ncbi:MAG: ribonuclease Y [Candidatus Dojkabacteria bacterium]|nr:ribonuclease Y [Candidatus Dojkabacteria bacterium]
METIIIVILVGALVFLYFRNNELQNNVNTLKNKLENLSDEDKKKLLDEESRKKIKEAEEKAKELLFSTEQELNKKRKSILEAEKSIEEREKLLENRTKTLNQKELYISQKETEIDSIKQSLEKEREQINKKLEEIAKLSEQEAKNLLMSNLEKKLEKQFADEIRKYREKLERESQTLTQEILISAITSSATDFVGEYSTSVFKVGGEEVKGKIIGKEGRNIKTFQKITGVDLVMDESDEYIVLSCFDPMRREIAKLALERLIKDGRINPAKIEEAVEKARIDFAKQIIKDGEEIAAQAGFNNLSLEQLKYLGRMRYRFSYGQCLATHTLEVVNIAAKIAAELGLDINLAKECALWHDIGKVVTHEKDGDHMQLGEELGIKLKLKPEVINAMYAHHMAKDPICMESAIIYIADANSGARPGARYGTDEDYVKRIKAMEEIAKKYPEVKEAYAVDAGREIRVFIDPVIMSDDGTVFLSQKIAEDIEKSMTYPGTIKVTVIREVRATSVAK